MTFEHFKELVDELHEKELWYQDELHDLEKF